MASGWHSEGTWNGFGTGKEASLLFCRRKECPSGVSDGVFRQGDGEVGQRRGRCGGAYEEFFAATVNEYDDLKYNRREIEENLLRRRHYA